MSAYVGPERRETPREIAPETPATERIIQRLEIIRRLIVSGHLERESEGPVGGARA